jgi:ABC-type transport system involved in multi-copper enzyme maturation permease subunit
MLRGKRTLALAGIAILPLLLGLAWKTVIDPPGTVTIERFYMIVATTVFLQFLLPLASLALAAGLVSDEADRGTILFLLTRPIPKGAILAGKFAAYLAASVVLLVISFGLLYASLRMKPGGQALGLVGGLAPYLGILLFGLLPYGALFALLGTVFKKPMVPAIVFAFGWEGLVGNLPGSTRLLTLTYYLRILMNRATGDSLSVLDDPFFIPESPGVPSAAVSAIVLGAVFVACLAASAVVLRRRQFALSRIQ